MPELDEQNSGLEDIYQSSLRQAVAARQHNPAAVAWEPRSLRVLVIDDNRDTAEATARLVRLLGHDVRQANGGYAGIAEAAAYRPDFLLLDIKMPSMDGCEAAIQLRLDSRFQGCFIVAITGHGDDEQRRRCQEAGIDLFLVKPVDPVVLESLLALERDSVNLPCRQQA